jgi:signal peptidase I
MNKKEITKNVKKAWNWIWHSDSFLSWIVALIVIFIIVKFIFFPVLSLITGSSLPLAGVESSSMDHRSLKICTERDYKGNCVKQSEQYFICGKAYPKKQYFDLDSYWQACGKWYEEGNLTKNQFEDFPLKNGFRKGDIIIIWGRFTPKVGDIIIFQPNEESTAPRPIIHRIVKIENRIIQTKGDHNQEQLTSLTSEDNIDETRITQDQIIGKAVFKIPYLGWLKIILVETLNKIF